MLESLFNEVASNLQNFKKFLCTEHLWWLLLIHVRGVAGPLQTSKTGSFVTVVNCEKSLSHFAKNSILVARSCLLVLRVRYSLHAYSVVDVRKVLFV